MLNRQKQHTPGPWFYYTGKLRPQFPSIIHEIQADDGTAIGKWGGFDGVDYSERKIGANALLMASAPELLAALKGAIPYLKPNTPAMVRRSIMLIRLRPTHTFRCTYAIYPVVSHNVPCHIEGIGR